MRNIRRMQYLFLLVCVILDLVVQSFWSQSTTSIEFVSQMSFMGFILSVRNDELKEYGVRLVVLALVMNLFHLDAFPLYLLSFGSAMVLVKSWYRHIGASFIEWLVMMGIALFIKEAVLYICLVLFQGYLGSFMFFMARRGVWVILGNLLLYRIVMMVWSAANGILLKKTRNSFN